MINWFTEQIILYKRKTLKKLLIFLWYGSSQTPVTLEKNIVQRQVSRWWERFNFRIFFLQYPYNSKSKRERNVINHHHHIVLAARISLTLSRHSSLSFIALGRSLGQQPVSSHSCWMYVRAGRPAFARPCVGIHKSTSLMSSSLLLQQCPACLVRLTWIVSW